MTVGTVQQPKSAAALIHEIAAWMRSVDDVERTKFLMLIRPVVATRDGYEAILAERRSWLARMLAPFRDTAGEP